MDHISLSSGENVTVSAGDVEVSISLEAGTRRPTVTISSGETILMTWGIDPKLLGVSTHELSRPLIGIF